MDNLDNFLGRIFIVAGIFFSVGCINVHGQAIGLIGIVKDTTNATHLANANILAFPKSFDESTKFAISNEKGEYAFSTIF